MLLPSPHHHCAGAQRRGAVEAQALGHRLEGAAAIGGEEVQLGFALGVGVH